MTIVYIIELSLEPGIWGLYNQSYYKTEKEAQEAADKLFGTIKNKLKKDGGVRVRALFPMGDEFEMEVQHAMEMLCDCVPYDDPDYHSKLRNMAEGAVRDMYDPNSSYNQMCKEHDKLLEEGKIDH